MYGWLDGWMIEGWMDGWMDERELADRLEIDRQTDER